MGRGERLTSDSVQVLLHRNMSGDKSDLLACVSRTHYPSDAMNTHKSSVVLSYERGWSARNDPTFNPSSKNPVFSRPA